MGGTISDFILTLECVLTLSLFRSLSVFTSIKHTGCVDDWKTFRKHTILCLIKLHIEHKKMCVKKQINYLNEVLSIGMIMFPLSAVDYLIKSLMPRVGNFPLSCWSSVCSRLPKQYVPKQILPFVALMKLKVSPYSWRYHTQQTQNMKESHSA